MKYIAEHSLAQFNYNLNIDDSTTFWAPKTQNVVSRIFPDLFQCIYKSNSSKQVLHYSS